MRKYCNQHDFETNKIERKPLGDITNKVCPFTKKENHINNQESGSEIVDINSDQKIEMEVIQEVEKIRNLKEDQKSFLADDEQMESFGYKRAQKLKSNHDTNEQQKNFLKAQMFDFVNYPRFSNFDNLERIKTFIDNHYESFESESKPLNQENFFDMFETNWLIKKMRSLEPITVGESKELAYFYMPTKNSFEIGLFGELKVDTFLKVIWYLVKKNRNLLLMSTKRFDGKVQLCSKYQMYSLFVDRIIDTYPGQVPTHQQNMIKCWLMRFIKGLETNPARIDIDIKGLNMMGLLRLENRQKDYLIGCKLYYSKNLIM